jgi:hypothetical protein
LSNAAKREAATLCASVIYGQNVIASFDEQIVEIVDDKIVRELTENWDGHHCEELAKLARALLGISSYIKKMVQMAVNWVMLKLGYGDTVRFFACQLIVLFPVPLNAKLVSAARILQVTGICLCFTNNNLMQCRCLHDLVEYEGKQAIEKLMFGAIRDWREIAARVPAVSADLS